MKRGKGKEARRRTAETGILEASFFLLLSLFFLSSVLILTLRLRSTSKKKNRTAMADVLARLEDGSLAAVDGGLLAEKVESAVSLLDRTMDLYG